MGASPSSYKKSGGPFNGDVTITGYSFLVGNSVEIKKGVRKGELFTPLSFVPTFRVDGADEDVSKRLLISDADVYGDVSEDGLTLSDPGEKGLRGEAALFISSLCANGFDESEFDEALDTINLEPIVGRRVRLEQVVNERKTADNGKEIWTGKDGKKHETDRKDLLVAEVYPGEAVKAVGQTSKVKAATKGKVGRPAKTPSVAEEAGKALVAVLSSKGGSIPNAKLRMALLTALTGKTENRDTIITYLQNVDNVNAVEGVETDGTTIVLAA